MPAIPSPISINSNALAMRIQCIRDAAAMHDAMTGVVPTWTW